GNLRLKNGIFWGGWGEVDASILPVASVQSGPRPRQSALSARSHALLPSRTGIFSSGVIYFASSIDSAVRRIIVSSYGMYHLMNATNEAPKSITGEPEALAAAPDGGLLAGTPADFARLATAFRAALNARDDSEQWQVDLAVLAVYQVRQVALALAGGALTP